MTRCSRGTALVETALSVSVSLLIVLGAAQMALIGYTQLSADGAAFVAAHASAANPGGDSVAAAQRVFKQFPSSAFATPQPSTNMDGATVDRNVSGFSLVPGLASTYAVEGKGLEWQAAGAGAGASTYSFDAVGTVLKNYCAPGASSCALPSSYSITLLGSGDINMNGNGTNGPFAAWRCHQKIYSRIAQSFTHYSPLNGYSDIQGTNLDPNKNNSDENSVYSWDSGSKCT